VTAAAAFRLLAFRVALAFLFLGGVV
jgi:hypothetical protein